MLPKLLNISLGTRKELFSEEKTCTHTNRNIRIKKHMQMKIKSRAPAHGNSKMKTTICGPFSPSLVADNLNLTDVYLLSYVMFAPRKSWW